MVGAIRFILSFAFFIDLHIIMFVQRMDFHCILKIFLKKINFFIL